MPRKTSATANAASNGKAAAPAPTEAATTEQKLQEIDTQLKAAAKANQPPKKQPAEPPKPSPEGNPKGIEPPVAVVPTIQQLPISITVAERLDGFLGSRIGRMLEAIVFGFLVSMPAYSLGFADGALKVIQKLHLAEPTTVVSPAPQSAVTPAATPIAPAPAK